MKNEVKLSLGKNDIQCLTLMPALGNEDGEEALETLPMTITPPLEITRSPLFC
ncbi:MAG: hypothetical protein GY940_33250 [bacterium]|nr:hypothetical protein [bacterium]